MYVEIKSNMLCHSGIWVVDSMKISFIYSFICLQFAMWGIKHRTLHMPGKCSPTEHREHYHGEFLIFDNF